MLVLGCYLGANYMPPKGKYCVCLLLIKFNSSNSEIKLKWNALLYSNSEHFMHWTFHDTVYSFHHYNVALTYSSNQIYFMICYIKSNEMIQTKLQLKFGNGDPCKLSLWIQDSRNKLDEGPSLGWHFEVKPPARVGFTTVSKNVLKSTISPETTNCVFQQIA